MEIDEHLKYTLYVIPPSFHFMDKSLTHFSVCNSIHARVPVSQWCQGGRLTTFCNKSSLKYDALQCPRLVEDRLELIKPILKEPFVHLKSQNEEYLEFTIQAGIWFILCQCAFPILCSYCDGG
jgi:hypothetical protein